jgi:general secretion pathway protein L
MKLSQVAPGPLLVLAEIAAWWLTQMRSLAPASLRGGQARQDALLIGIDRWPKAASHAPPAGTLWLRRSGRESLFGSLSPDHDLPVLNGRMATGLRLPPGSVLTREVDLPLAASRQLQGVMRFEMDRLTPFTADELYWGVSGVVADRARNRLRLQLAFVLRAPVDQLCESLARRQIFPSFIEAPGGNIALAAAAPQRHWLAVALPALCAVLALLCLVSPFLRQQMALNAVSQVIAQRQPAAAVALALRRRLSDAAFGQTAIAEAQRQGDALQVLANLTDALPDGTWLDDLALKSGTLNLDGQSTDAAALIGLLSAAPGLHDPSFTAPVTRTANGKDDQFSLQATVGP